VRRAQRTDHKTCSRAVARFRNSGRRAKREARTRCRIAPLRDYPVRTLGTARLSSATLTCQSPDCFARRCCSARSSPNSFPSPWPSSTLSLRNLLARSAYLYSPLATPATSRNSSHSAAGRATSPRACVTYAPNEGDATSWVQRCSMHEGHQGSSTCFRFSARSYLLRVEGFERKEVHGGSTACASARPCIGFLPCRSPAEATAEWQPMAGCPSCRTFRDT
jgi:hypothetical protein